MSTVKVFAPDVARNDKGWIMFPPRDTEWRRQYFPGEVFKHPAKMSMYVMDALIDYLTEEGDTILEPFGGTGTAMIGALKGRHVKLIELEDGYHDLIMSTIRDWEDRNLHTGNIALFKGDNRQILPLSADHCITSPPYSTAMMVKEGGRVVGQGMTTEAVAAYSTSPLNLSNLNPFVFKFEMQKVYKGIQQSLRPGGYMAVVIKDMMEAGSRKLLSVDTVRMANEEGFELVEWHKWLPPGSSFKQVARSKGKNTVDDEDIIIFRKRI